MVHSNHTRVQGLTVSLIIDQRSVLQKVQKMIKNNNTLSLVGYNSSCSDFVTNSVVRSVHIFPLAASLYWVWRPIISVPLGSLLARLALLIGELIKAESRTSSVVNLVLIGCIAAILWPSSNFFLVKNNLISFWFLLLVSTLVSGLGLVGFGPGFLGFGFWFNCVLSGFITSVGFPSLPWVGSGFTGKVGGFRVTLSWFGG